MEITLFKHNQTAYDAAVRMMEEEGKAAVIHPTGTGKSFIAFKLAQEFHEANICWLAPSEYIFNTQLENLKKTMPQEGDISFPNIRFFSYSKLIKNENLMEEICPDYIVLDEFHRCGALEWGKGVRKLLDRYPKAKLLGLSATNIRYLDGQRDMAQEIFGGNIASEMTLGEAIVRGILNAPKYVIALYSYEKELDRLERRIKKQLELKMKGQPTQEVKKPLKGSTQEAEKLLKKNAAKTLTQGIEAQLEQVMEKSPEQKADERSVQKEGQWQTQKEGQRQAQKAEQYLAQKMYKPDSGEEKRLLEQLRRALERAEGLDEVFRKHISNPHGKYIIFCADKAHMDEVRSHVCEWFHLVDRNPKVYTAYYGTPGTDREFDAFKKDQGKHLKLLFCIDMLNEGVHVEDVDGVILLRPTVSPILYLQQIGRALSAGSRKEPVIFDLVNNLEGLCCIDYLEQELEEALEESMPLMPCNDRERRKYEGRFRIIDEAKDCRRLFAQLQSRLGASWDSYYLAAKEYYREKGNLRIPKNYVTPYGLNLGSWIQTQRKVYAGKAAGNLTEEKAQKLEAIGMEWSLKESSWERGYGELAAYYEKYGNVDVKARYVSESGFALGKWVSNLRGNVKKKGMDKVLSQERRSQLEALGMVWDKQEDKWETYLKAAENYRREYGNLKIPAGYVTEEGIPLGNWLHCLKHGKSGNKSRAEALTKEQKAQLDALGMEWEKEGAILWNQKFVLAKAYYERNGNLDMPVSYCVEGIKLGRWISNIRTKRKNPDSSGMVLDEERIRQLDSIGMDWK